MNNESVITGFLRTYILEKINLTPGDIANANREALFRLLTFIQSKFDYDVMFQQLVEKANPVTEDVDISQYLPDGDDNETKRIIQEVLMTTRASSRKSPPQASHKRKKTKQKNRKKKSRRLRYLFHSIS